MKILNLKLENFQGIKRAEFDFAGKNSSIFGDNATGKTTVFNAVTYLLFDKASTGAKNFTPKTRLLGGEAHHLEHSVEAAFRLDDGRIICLKKVFHENYKKKRGSATEEFDGHSVDFFVDGVPAKEKDYHETLLSVGDIEKMKILTMPDYFAEGLKWDARRRILLDICGDITDQEIMNSNPELKKLVVFLTIPGTSDQQYTVDEYKKIAKSQITKINKQLQNIPGRIDEAERAIPDLKAIDPIRIKEVLNSLHAEKEELEKQKNKMLQNNNPAAIIEQKMTRLKAELSGAKADYMAENNQSNEAIYEEINQLKEKQMNIKDNLLDYKNNLAKENEQLKKMEETRERLFQQYKIVQSETWDEKEEFCSKCGQHLPEDMIQELKENFNLRKSAHLASINSQGQQQASKSMIADKKALIVEIEAKIAASESEIESLAGKIIGLKSKIKNFPPFEDSERYRSINSQLILLEQDQHNVEAVINAETADIRDKIEAINLKIQEQEEKKVQLKIAEAQKGRIAELEEEEKSLSVQFEKAQQGLYLCEQFIKSKVNMLTDKINSKFENVRFKLFIEQLNGGLKEDCEVMIPDNDGNLVEYTLANNAARINAGLEIIDVIGKHWDMSMPVFVDNAESITKLKDIGSQVIRLVVSEQDQKLRMVG